MPQSYSWQQRGPQRGSGGISCGGNPPTQNLPQIKFRENGNLRRELLTKEAKAYADAFKGKLTTHQMRRFYNEVKALEARIEADREKGYEKNEALIGMLKAKVAYASNRPTAKVPQEFVTFIERGVDAIHSLQDFKDFTLFFEAVVGFSDLR